ncbi:MAG: hypothetical protein IKQ94_07305 [Bacteroidales bacterium]|nr:hypothetical protein [Bacteroidales bacterium]
MKPILSTLLKILGITLGLAVCILATLGVAIDAKIMLVLLGSGIVCLGISLFDEKSDNDNSSDSD